MNPSYIFICVPASAIWTLTDTGKYCPDGTYDYRRSLGDCKIHCEANGAKRLTFEYYDRYDSHLCRCCPNYSKLSVVSGNNQIYTILGKYMYLPTRKWCRNV